jgi:histidinol phosphatase-like enzyme (inositol monophosphatase family)
MDHSSLPKFLDRLADAASDSIMPHFRAGGAVENKGATRFDPVTAADREAEAAMRRLIASHFPAHGIIGEEYGPDRPDAEFVWVLDPIDGTRSFILGLPVWGTLIGLLHHGRPVLGMMAQPFTGERYAGDGRHAWYAGPGGNKDIRARSCDTLREAALLTTTPFLFSDAERQAYNRVEGSVRMARYGCDCYAYCMVASGHADVVVESGLQDFDVVALIPIIEGAGGRFTNWQGGSAAAGGSIVASGDPQLHALVLERLAGESS